MNRRKYPEAYRRYLEDGPPPSVCEAVSCEYDDPFFGCMILADKDKCGHAFGVGRAAGEYYQGECKQQLQKFFDEAKERGLVR